MSTPHIKAAPLSGDRMFHNRSHAGRVLAHLLPNYANRNDVVLLGLPRGGVPVAFEVARELNVPLDVLVVRKLGVPGYQELAMGAIASGGVRVLNDDVMKALGISSRMLEHVAVLEQRELERREQLYRAGRSALPLEKRIVIIVDDGLATGSTMHAAVNAVRQQHPASIVIAVPIAARETCDEFQDCVDECVCALTPEHFYAVGYWYEDFTPVTDEEVSAFLLAAQETASTC